MTKLNPLTDPWFRISTGMYKIVDKNNQLIPFIPNNAQNITINAYKKHWNLYILKWRQLWITTLFVVIKWDKALWLPNENVVITAHKIDKLNEIFHKVKIMHENIPKEIWNWWKRIVKPQAKYDSKSELYFWETNSRIKVALDSRSGTVSDLHLTEIAFMSWYAKMMAWTVPALTPFAKNHITIETTANGMSWDWADAYNLWKNCVKKVEDWEQPPFYPVFLPWYIEDWYEEEKPQNFIIPEDIKLYAPHIKKGYKELVWKDLSRSRIENKLYWYYQEKNRIEASVGKEWGLLSMKQEYPTFPEEAFLTTGSWVFDNYKLNELDKVDLYYDEDEHYKDLRIYRPPEACMIWIDTAWGNKNWDYFSIIWRNENFELLFHYYSIATPDEAVEALEHIVNILWYHWTIWLEVNAQSGWETLKLIQFNENITDHVFMYERSRRKVWFLTTEWPRNDILDHLEAKVKTWVIDEFDSREIHEMRYFIRNDKKKREATTSEHDDAIMSDAICCYLIQYEGVATKSEVVKMLSELT